MDSVSLQRARSVIGEIVDRARIAGTPTLITRHGKPAAVVVSETFYTTALGRPLRMNWPPDDPNAPTAYIVPDDLTEEQL